VVTGNYGEFKEVFEVKEGGFQTLRLLELEDEFLNLSLVSIVLHLVSLEDID